VHEHRRLAVTGLAENEKRAIWWKIDRRALGVIEREVEREVGEAMGHERMKPQRSDRRKLPSFGEIRDN
jgi:hypothetical protein